MTERYGAEAEDWRHFDAMGLTEDLLPAVCNPSAVISPGSKMKSVGKTPSHYNRNGQVAGFSEWTNYRATVADVKKWSKNADYGICLQSRTIRGIDVDVPQTGKAQLILDFIGEFFEFLLPMRFRSNSGKFLLAFRMPGEFRKRKITVEGGIIEFLATGQQFLVAGVHESGVPYQWDGGLPGEFPVLSLEQFEALWQALVEKFATAESGNKDYLSRRRADTPALNIKDPLLDVLPVIGWGRHGEAYIECPWSGEHSMDSGETQTCYFPAGSRGYEQGHFHCLHAHCENRTDADFLDAYELRAAEFDVIPDEPAEQKKIFNIKMRGGDLPQVVEQAEEALMASGMAYYQRGSCLVRPVTENLEAAGGRKTKVVRLFNVDVPYLTHDLCQSANWLVQKSKTYVKVNAPREVAVTLLSNYGRWKLPRIAGVISTPTLRPDGSVLCQEGFDPATGLLLTALPLMPAIPEHPTYGDATAALSMLKDLLVEFPFVDGLGRSVALSCLITPVVRGAFPVAPMHVVRAPTPGSGKSFLLDVAAAIAIGQPCPVMAAGRSEEETEKRLASALMAGQLIINVDNVNGSLGGDFLCQLIERPVVEVRILGKTQIVEIESRSTLFATGNNINLPGDMVRRVLVCVLDPNTERPELRKFRSNPVAKVLARRGDYIAAILTIVRAYVAAGRPGRAAAIASFGAWSDMVRSALIWLGEEDPVRSMELARTEDPLQQRLNAVLTSLRDCIGIDRPMGAADILKAAQWGDGSLEGGNDRYEIFSDALLNAINLPFGQINSKHLGHWLTRHKGRISNGLKLNGRLDSDRRAIVWWVSEENDLV